MQEHTSEISDIRFEQINEDNFHCVEKLRDKERAQCFLSMHQNGQYCLGTFYRDSLIGHAVLIPPYAQHNQVSIKNSGFIHFCYVDPAYRGHGIYPNMLNELIQRTHTLYGINRYSISTAPDNNASQNGINKIGFTDRKLHKSIVWWRFVIGRVRV